MHVSSPTDAAELGTVLGIWAHPDDEAYLSAALMALARRAGNRVTVITATRGELGTPDPERWPPGRLARTREHELAASLAALGVSRHRWLGYRDGECADVDPRPAVDQLAQIMVDELPDTIVTFGPDGMTGHSDHRAISAWATDAWYTAGRPGQLLYATKTAAFCDEFAAEHARFDVFMPGLPVRMTEQAVGLSVSPDDAVVDQKLAALRAQATQTTALIDAFGEDRYRSWIANETFVAAVVPVALAA